jgi:hypothetical protein
MCEPALGLQAEAPPLYWSEDMPDADWLGITRRNQLRSTSAM